MGTFIDFQAGSQMVKGYLAKPAQGSGPGVLVLHAWWGLNTVFTGVCDRLAAEGFAAFAPDLNAGTVASTIDEAKALMDVRNYEQTGGVAFAALAHLQQQVEGRPIGIIGFSMGAAWALLISTQQPADVAAAVTFYGTYTLDFSMAQAAYQCHFAQTDEWEPQEQVQDLEASLRSAGRATTFYTYSDTQHWFFEDNRPEYQPEAADLAWQRTVAFLRERLT